MSESRIEWTGSTWNPITGCTKISAGCLNCYAERMHARLRGMRPDVYPESFLEITFHPERVTPSWIKKQGWKDFVFVDSMTDLFQDGVLFTWLKQIWEVMAAHPDITFQLLTKRPKNMKVAIDQLPYLKNVWLGVTCENQQAADERIPILLDTPAEKRFISVEPMLEPVYIVKKAIIECPICLDGERYTNVTNPDKCFRCGAEQIVKSRVDWVICGAETGPGARYMDPEWAVNLYDQCREAGTPFFMKKWSKKDDGGLMFDYVRQFPEVGRA